MISDKIIEGSIRKEEKACKALYEQCIPYVYSIVKRYLWEEENRKDIIQEVFASVFRKIDQFDSERGNFNMWIRKISINHCLMFLRKEERNAAIVPIGKISDKLENKKFDLHALTREDLDRILSVMPSGYRTIFLLVVIDEYSHEEVSELLSISRETSRSQLSRAKSWIKNYFFSKDNVRADGIF